jgi:hypothetical protein
MVRSKLPVCLLAVDVHSSCRSTRVVQQRCIGLLKAHAGISKEQTEGKNRLSRSSAEAPAFVDPDTLVMLSGRLYTPQYPAEECIV